ncbi:MAG TPA: hypothetical protein VFL91_13815 [Thermomicrobiales bacterium]|nr:hypothetical protein [Thermomicrobiales bacterium]
MGVGTEGPWAAGDATRPLPLLGGDDDLVAPEEAATLPAGAVALGRGGAGTHGALLCDDGTLVGLLALGATAPRTARDVATLAAALPPMACQFLTVRRPVDRERRLAAWERLGLPGGAWRAGRGALLRLAAAGWSEARSYVALFDADGGRLCGALATLAEVLPWPARPCTLPEVKALAGDWFAPAAAGLVTIGWAVRGLAATPEPDWPRALLEVPALAGLPVVLALHLDPVGEDEVDGPWRPARAGAGGLPRRARLLLGCSVAPENAWQVRAAVEDALGAFGFEAAAIGPARGHDLLRSCAPLGRPALGRALALRGSGAALLAPVAPAHPAVPLDRAPLAVARDGSGLALADGESLVVGGDAGGTLRAGALTGLARGAAVTAVVAGGGWADVATALDGARVPVAGALPALLGDLGFPAQDVARLDTWVTEAAALLGDLCPTFTGDDEGDLVALLLALAEDHRAGRDLLHLRRLAGRARESGNAALAAALEHLATPTASGTPDAPAAPAARCAIFDASGTPGADGPALPGLATVAVRAALARLRAAPHGEGHLVILDALPALVAGRAGTRAVAELLATAREAGAAVWCATEAVGALPAPVAAALRALAPAVLVRGGDAGELDAVARWLGLTAPRFRAPARGEAGQLFLVRDERCEALDAVLEFVAAPRALPRDARMARHVGRPKRRAAADQWASGR